MTDYENLIQKNRNMRCDFLAQADYYTAGNYPVKVDGNIRFLTWHYLFRKYIDTVEKLSFSCPDITKFVGYFDTERLWDGQMRPYLDRTVDFLDKDKLRMAEAFIDCSTKSNSGFTFIDNLDGYQICYSEDFKMPGFSNIAIQIDDERLAKISMDYLAAVPGIHLHDGMPRLIAVKLLSKKYNPRRYLLKEFMQVKHGRESLSPNPKVIQIKNGR
ncbi:MAG: hypothetical protein LBJ73_01460 [Rickettsiales bacterium]|nr:hypothetical protein [Rickettsiales bacterium]